MLQRILRLNGQPDSSSKPSRKTVRSSHQFEEEIGAASSENGLFIAKMEFSVRTGEAEREVTLTRPDSEGVRRARREYQLPASLRIRLIRVELEDGEIEVLGTSLRDRAKYPCAEFKQVYGYRWNEERGLRRLKSIFELERFSGTSSLAIEQDFYGVIFLASLESILSKSDEAELQRQVEQQQRKYAVQVNHAVSYLALVDHTISLLLDEEHSIEQTLEDLHRLFRTTRGCHKVCVHKISDTLWAQTPVSADAISFAGPLRF